MSRISTVTFTPRSLLNARLIAFFQKDSYFDRSIHSVKIEDVLRITTKFNREFLAWARLPKLIRFLAVNGLDFEVIFINDKPVEVSGITALYPKILHNLQSQSNDNRLQMEQDFLRQQKRRMEALKNLLVPQASIAVISIDGIYKSPDYLLGKTIAQIIDDPIESDRVMRQINRAYHEGQTIEIHWQKPNGECWVSKITPVHGEKEVLAVCHKELPLCG